jgi:hypothetical protein
MQIEIALRLQFGDAHHAALIGGNEARQQIGEADFLGLHGVAAGSNFNSGPGELADMFSQIGIGRGRVECPQRLAMNHQRDGDIVGPADPSRWFWMLPATKLTSSRSLR